LQRQFDIFVNPAASRSSVPYLLVLQNDLLGDTYSVLCAPLIPRDVFPATQGLNPTISVAGTLHVLAPDQMAPLPRHMLKTRVETAEGHRDAIARAIDLLFFGI
jgi:hypothetical protein